MRRTPTGGGARPLAAWSLGVLTLWMVGWAGPIWMGGSCGFAWAEQLELTHYTPRDGLPQEQVLGLVRDPSGYLWIGSFAGLTRYDGGSFETFDTGDGLPSNVVLDLDLTPDGRIVAHTGGGVCLVDPGALEASGDPGRAIECPALDVGDARLRQVTVDLDGSLWIATDDRLLHVAAEGLLDAPLAIERFAGQLPGTELHTAVDSAGGLWVGGTEGLRRRVGDRLEAFEGPLASAPILVSKALEDRVLVATPELLAWIDPATSIATPVPRPPELAADAAVRDAARDALGRLWISTTHGLMRIDGETTRWFGREAGLLSLSVGRMFVDSEHILWMGTDSGLSKLVPGPFSLFGVADGLPNSLVRALALDGDGDLWIGTRDGLAVRRAGTDGRFEPVDLEGVDDSRIFGLAVGVGGGDGDGGVLLGTRRGLVWRTPDGQIQVWRRGDEGLPSDFIPSLLADGERVWVGTTTGLGVWRAGRFEALEIPQLERGFILDIHRARDGRLWLALGSGVVVLERPELGAASPIRRLGADDGLSDGSIWALAEDAAGGLWMGTNGDGAFRLAADGTIRRLGLEDGLVDPFIWQVQVDRGGDVWLYSSRGLHRFDGETVTHFGPGDGLSVLEGTVAASVEDAEGVLWFGTSKGIVRYDRTSELSAPKPPRVVIQEARSERDERLRSSAVVPSSFGWMTLRVAGLSLRDETGVEFRWRLDGGPWSQPGTERSLRFASVAPGAHRFEIDARNDAGWSLEPAHFDLEVTPPFWQSWLFRVALLSLAVVALAGYVRLRLRRLVRERVHLESVVAERTLQLERRSERLEREIEERTQAEAARRHLEERLRQSEKMEAVGRLAGGVAHDFNNLLTSIRGYADLLAADLPPSAAAQTDLEEIQRATERAGRLTHQLLAFSRKQVIEPTVLHLNDVVQELASMLERLLGEDVHLETDLAAWPDLVRVDRGHLEQVLINLSVNARDSMPVGGRLSLRTVYIDGEGPARASGARPTVDGLEASPVARGAIDRAIDGAIDAATFDDGPRGPSVVLEVEDDGQGMEPELVEHIFEPFFTTKERGRGTGLGLATVYGIVRQNGGSIAVESQPGAGTTFRVALPLARGEVPREAPRAGARLTGGAGLGVLVVEDEASVRNLLRTLLAKSGFDVEVASDGEEAMARLETMAPPPSLLISDLVMPGLNGRQVADRFLARHPGARVLLISGYPAEVLGERGILPADAEFLRKPFTPGELLDAVQAALGEPIAS